MRYFYSVILFLLISSSGWAQTFLTGKVRNKQGGDLLISVSIQNHTQSKYDLSDERGEYRIPAKEGDLLTFSSVGYKTDTLIITLEMLLNDHPVVMEEKAVTLATFHVGSLSNYQLDSIERREEYKWVYDHGNGGSFIDKNRHSDGVGVSLNLFRNSSKADRDWGMLKKRLLKEEEEHYIDFRYPREYISRLTHLQGPDLQRFMQLYRPSYDYTRKAASVDILVFISDSFKKFKTLPLPGAGGSGGQGPSGQN